MRLNKQTRKINHIHTKSLCFLPWQVYCRVAPPSSSSPLRSEGCSVVPCVCARVGAPREQPRKWGTLPGLRPAAAVTGHDSYFRSYFHVFHLASPPLSAAAHRNGSRHKRAGFCPAPCPADTFLWPWRARRTPVLGIQHTGAHTATSSLLCSRLPPNTLSENGNKK